MWAGMCLYYWSVSTRSAVRVHVYNYSRLSSCDFITLAFTVQPSPPPPASQGDPVITSMTPLTRRTVSQENSLDTDLVLEEFTGFAGPDDTKTVPG